MRTLKYFILFVIVFLGISWIYLPRHYSVTYPKSLEPVLDKRVRDHFQYYIESYQPDIVLLGDSTLAESVDPEMLSEILDQEVYQIGYSGSASAVWYLIVKNNIITAATPPDHLVLFFRSTILTTPDYLVTGKYFEFVDELASPDDIVLLERAYVNQYSWAEKLAEQYVPLYGERFQLLTILDRLVKYPLLRTLFDIPPDQIDYALDTIFQTQNRDLGQLNIAIQNVLSDLYSPQNLNFNRQVERSFLPEIIRLCESNEITVTFVHMKSLEYPTQESEPRALQRYMRDLETYFSDRGIQYFDLSQLEALTDDHFKDLIHLNIEGQLIFTQILAEALAEVDN